MKVTKNAVLTAAAAGGIAAASVFAATPAVAAPNIQGFGVSEQLVDGPLVTDYTVSNLQPSNVSIPGYTPKGTLYQADISVRSDGGVVTPMVHDFIARGPNGQNYRVIDNVAVPNGLSPAPIPQHRVDRDAVLRRDRRSAQRRGLQRRHAGRPDVDLQRAQLRTRRAEQPRTGCAEQPGAGCSARAGGAHVNRRTVGRTPRTATVRGVLRCGNRAGPNRVSGIHE